MICKFIAACSWLSSYPHAEDYISKEQSYFQQKAQQLAPLQQQLLSELRQHISSYQVPHNLLTVTSCTVTGTDLFCCHALNGGCIPRCTGITHPGQAVISVPCHTPTGDTA